MSNQLNPTIVIKHRVEIFVREKSTAERPKIIKSSSSEKEGRKVDVKVERPAKAATSGIQVDVISVPFVSIPLAKVTRIRALSLNDLPTKYVWHRRPSSPIVWQDGKKLMAGERCILLEEGSVYKQSYLQEALLYIELAGRHLTAINKEKRLYLSEDVVTTLKDGVFKRRASYDKPY